MNLNTEQEDDTNITLDAISNQDITIEQEQSHASSFYGDNIARNHSPASNRNITIQDQSCFSSFHGDSIANESPTLNQDITIEQEQSHLSSFHDDHSPTLQSHFSEIQNMTIYEPQQEESSTSLPAYQINTSTEYDFLFRKAGIELFGLIRSISSETKRRHLMAILCGEEKWITRKEISSILQKTVHKREYAAAIKHKKFPGAGMPIPLKKYFQKRIRDDTMAEFMEWLHAAGYLQSLAYGHKNVQLCNGVHIAIESVKRTKNVRSIVRLYSANWVEEGLASHKRETLLQSKEQNVTVSPHCDGNDEISELGSDITDTAEDNGKGFHISGVESIAKNDSFKSIGDNSGSSPFGGVSSEPDKSASNAKDNDENIGECCLEHWCNKKNPKTRTFCLKERDHPGKCQFTPKGKLSPSSIERVLSQLTSGDLKSLRGLDNIDVEKGHENFERMKAIVSSLLDVGNFGHGGCPEASDILKNIDESQEFHKIDFPRHLGQGES